MSDPTTDSTDRDAHDPLPARLLYGGLWKYRGYHNCPSVCHLRLFAPVTVDKPLIAVFTELDENRGTSVTNRIEHLATLVWHWQERPERGLTTVEHYPNRGMHNPRTGRWQYPEEFDIVTFEISDGHRFTRPKWRRVSRELIEEMIGQPFVAIVSDAPPL